MSGQSIGGGRPGERLAQAGFGPAARRPGAMVGEALLVVLEEKLVKSAARAWLAGTAVDAGQE